VGVEEVEGVVAAVEERNPRKSAYLNNRLGEEVENMEEVEVEVHSLYALVDRILDVRVRQHAVPSNYNHISVVLENTARRRA
jgi:hypothetical protein